MPTVHRTRTISAPLAPLWQTVSDPHHLPRWWPRVVRVEDVTDTAFTEVLASSQGRLLRADFALLDRTEHPHLVRWRQLLQGSPFARLLKSAQTTVSLTPADTAGLLAAPLTATSPAAAPLAAASTTVTIELRQSLAGFFPRFGSFMVRKAALHTIEEALDGLERIAAPR
ncbi:MAG TPA: SRPBCC family protein [Solirubrobacteraceae bacterium]|nr:SRPBCC family protein [Solirubrobacteraceae bacterium]